jgi:hypothetical protein
MRPFNFAEKGKLAQDVLHGKQGIARHQGSRTASRSMLSFMSGCSESRVVI